VQRTRPPRIEQLYSDAIDADIGRARVRTSDMAKPGCRDRGSRVIREQELEPDQFRMNALRLNHVQDIA
jgi:hypothetical protein